MRCARRLTTLAPLVLAFFLIAPALAQPAWNGFPIIQWQQRTPAQLQALKRIGVTAGTVVADRDGDGAREGPQAAKLRDAGMHWYIENIATDYYSSYHRYTPGKKESWRFEAAQAEYRAYPEDPAALLRNPGLSDPVWQRRIHDRLTATVRRHAPDHPLFYDLGDETGIADLSAFWDFDVSPASLAGMRAWLRSEYGSLGALNAEWGTSYARWDAVQPQLTRDAMRRTDGNFAQWSDFKAWMDVAFAGALRRGTDAVHAADRHALAAIEGAQIPGWGGYDYTRLAHAVDVMEIYDSGENLPILRSLNPAVVPLTTAFADTPVEMHRLWRSVLRGVRGMVLWDEDDSIVRADASAGPRAAAYAPLFAALHGTFGQAVVGATPLTDPVAVLYSPASFRVRWMLDHKPLGDAWMQRSAEIELEDNAFRVALRGYAEALARLGLQPRYVAPAELAAGRLGAKVLILPDAIALSPAEACAVTAFARGGGRVIASTQPGLFDAHGKRLARPSVPAGVTQSVPPGDVDALRAAMGLVPRVALESAVPVDRFAYRGAAGLLLALQTAAPAAAPVAMTLTLPTAATLRNVATGEVMPRASRFSLTLDPVVPTLLEIGR